MIKIPAGTHVYRAQTVAKEGRWFTLSLQDAFTYGSNITEYETIRDLTMINLMSLTFHLDFMDRLNAIYPGLDHTGYDADKIKCLIPLGLVDLDTQQQALNLMGSGQQLNDQRWSIVHDYTSRLMLNRHRFSAHSIDTHMVTVMENIYGSYYDGYVSPIRWPTKMHGDFFPRELFCFKLGNVREVQAHQRPPQAGGYNSIKPITNNFIPLWNPHTDEGLPTKEFKFTPETLELIKKATSNKFTPLWNPHTDEGLPTKEFKFTPETLELIKKATSNKFTPLWNPHTDESNLKTINRRKTRKITRK